MENFDKPYQSLSTAEFWHRWHISLSTWFRDYVYIPLGGNRVTPGRHVLNLLATFGLSGLWHGANWTYVFWGLLNGAYLACGLSTRNVRTRIFGSIGLAEDAFARRVIRWSTTFLLTCAAWVLFRARTLDDAWYILTHVAIGWDLNRIATEQFLLRQMPVAVGAIALLELLQLRSVRTALVSALARLPIVPRWGVYASFAMGVVMFGVYRKMQFIYFQF